MRPAASRSRSPACCEVRCKWMSDYELRTALRRCLCLSPREGCIALGVLRRFPSQVCGSVGTAAIRCGKERRHLRPTQLRTRRGSSGPAQLSNGCAFSLSVRVYSAQILLVGARTRSRRSARRRAQLVILDRDGGALTIDSSLRSAAAQSDRYSPPVPCIPAGKTAYASQS
jgi:hypothetical protein